MGDDPNPEPRMCIAPELRIASPCAWLRGISEDYIQANLRRIKLGWRNTKTNTAIPKLRYLWMSSKPILLKILCLILLPTSLPSCVLYCRPNFVDLQVCSVTRDAIEPISDSDPHRHHHPIILGGEDVDHRSLWAGHLSIDVPCHGTEPDIRKVWRVI